MGHVRLGRLPLTARWRQVVQLLDDSPQITSELAARITEAAEGRLNQLKTDESLTYAFWLLTRIASSARGGDFVQQLNDLGLIADQSLPTLNLISDLADKVRQRANPHIASGDFGAISSLALQSALTETVALQSASLLGSTVDDLRAAFQSYSTPSRFSIVAERFFAAFFARTLASALDRQIDKHIGPANSIRNIAECVEFRQALSSYSRQVAGVVHDFARDWYSLHNWLTDHDISPEESRGFIGHALDKLIFEMKQGRQL